MSASLVGSEMCIRDSFKRLSRHLHRSPEASGALGRLPVPPGGFLSSPEAVSYTHLTLPTICSV
eukprot:10326030-Alexandrium_andersonii.AAC.1